MEVKTTTKTKHILSILFSDFKIVYLQDAQVYWTGSFYLESFLILHPINEVILRYSLVTCYMLKEGV